MKCAWKELLGILPPHLRPDVDRHGRETLQELRLRVGQLVQLNCGNKVVGLSYMASKEDISYIVNAASRYSPWAASTVSQGYITAPGGHRIGICGECLVHSGIVTGIKEITSVCLRVARDFPELADNLHTQGSVLILGPPGSGKTTLLRNLIRKKARDGKGTVSVVDERSELFPEGISGESGIDVLTGCPKPVGMLMLLRTMGPSVIAVDEVTSEEDCRGILDVSHCGTELLATAHAHDTSTLLERRIYRPLWDAGVFQTVIIMSRDKSWRKERILR